MTLEAWDDDGQVTYDRAVWSELVALRFVEHAHNAFILGPVGVGKTFLATALGHIACRRRISVHFERADKLSKRLEGGAPRHQLRRRDAQAHRCRPAHRRRLLPSTPLDATETADIYELVVERHHGAATVSRRTATRVNGWP